MSSYKKIKDMSESNFKKYCKSKMEKYEKIESNGFVVLY